MTEKNCLDLLKESQEFDMIFENVLELAHDGLTFDGSHHKRYFAQEILKLVDIDLITNDFACPP